MFRRLFIGVLLVPLFWTTPSFAATSIYKSKNKIDFVKIDKAKKQEKEGGLQHPHTFDADQIRGILRSLHFNKKVLLFKDVENRQLFDEGNVEFLTPYLVEAFQKVGPEEAIIVSYFTRDSKVVIQNDRLTVFRAFVKEDGLHLKFQKLYAKLLGDRVTQGATRAMQEARQLRVSLELQPGQNRISWDPEELVIDLSMKGGDGLSPKPEETKATPVVEKKGKKVKSQEVSSSQESEVTKSVRDRLKELDQLKKDELITEKEYQRKRKELIDQL